MKKLYPLATLLLGSFILISGAQAQYTAVRNGNWHVASGLNVWDPNGEPPSNCINCTITINSGVSVTLNAHLQLSGGSILTLGTDGSSAAVLTIPASTGVDWVTSYNIILPNDGSTPQNAIVLHDGLAFVNPAGAGRHDGVLTSYTSGSSVTYFKKLGNSPDGFIDTTAVSFSPAAYGNTTEAGPVTLSANGTLPITLTDFNAVVNSGAVDLSWTTKASAPRGISTPTSDPTPTPRAASPVDRSRTRSPTSS